MKKASLKYLLFPLILTFGCSDDYLDVLPVDQVTPENFYQTEEQIFRAVTGAYSPLGNRGMYGWWLGPIRNVRTDDAITVEANIIAHSNFTETDTDIRLFSRTNGNGLWNSLYFGILRTNLVIARTPEAELPNQDRANRLIAEARFLRALYYWHLVTYWGEVPLLLTDNLDATDVAKASINEVYLAIENDLQWITENEYLPWSFDGGVNQEKGRATLGSTYSLLGKVYLQQEKFAEAISAFERVVQQGGYSLIDVNDIWTVAGDNSTESVFEVQFNNTNAGINPFFDDGQNAAETTLRNQTLAPNQYNGWENAWPSDDLVAEFEPGDLRRQAFIIVPGESFPNQSTPFQGAPRNRGNYAIRKGMNSGWTTGSPNGTGEENFPLIRYADVLLMYSEALIRTNQNLQLAVDLIDQVRVRAFGASSIVDLRNQGLGIENYAFDKGIDLFTALKHERRVELCFEGHRFTDLVRWGDASTNPMLLDNGYTSEKRFYPLSREDLDLSTLLQ